MISLVRSLSRSCHLVSPWSQPQAGEGSGSSVLTGSSRQKAEVKIMNEQVAKALAKQEAKREKKLQRKKDWDDLFYKVGLEKLIIFSVEFKFF